MKIKMAVADSNNSYVERLHSILEKKDNLVISVFTSTDALKKSLCSQKYDILLLSEDIDDGSLNYNMVSALIYLTDNEYGTIDSSYPKYDTIYKYQNIIAIYNNAMEIYSEIATNSLGNNNKSSAKVIAVYSPAGGTGTTTVSLAIASGLANRGSRTLYLNLEDISSYGVFLKQSGEKNFGDIVSKIGNNINWNLKINSIANHADNGIMYFNELSNILDVYEITPEDIKELLNGICSSDICDYIVIDMSSSLDYRSRAVFDVSDSITAVVSNSETACCKFKKFLDQYDIISENIDNLKIVCNMGKTPSEFENAYHTIAVIPYISNAGFSSIVDYICQKNQIDISSLI